MSLTYNVRGTVIGPINGHAVKAHHDGDRHYVVSVDGDGYGGATRFWTEEILEVVTVQLKQTGPQKGYPSEPVPRAIFRT